MKNTSFFIKSFFLGAIESIPGISAGALSLIFNMYYDLIFHISNFFKIKSEKRSESFLYLFKVCIFAILGLFIFSKISNFFGNNYKNETALFFTFLIIFSISIINKNSGIKKFNLSYFIFLIIGFLVVLYLGKETELKDAIVNQKVAINFNYLFQLFFKSILIGTSMILPGISGSFVMLLTGEYGNIMYFISNLELSPLIIIAIGILTSIILFSKLVNYLLNNYMTQTIGFTIGTLIGSIPSLIPNYSYFSNNIFKSIGIIILSFFISYIINKSSKAK